MVLLLSEYILFQIWVTIIYTNLRKPSDWKIDKISYNIPNQNVDMAKLLNILFLIQYYIRCYHMHNIRWYYFNKFANQVSIGNWRCYYRIYTICRYNKFYWIYHFYSYMIVYSWYSKFKNRTWNNFYKGYSFLVSYLCWTGVA